jgi:hypothetical protein
VLLSLSAVVIMTFGIAGATDKSKFDSLIGKYAADAEDAGFDKFSPKAGCV